MKAISITEERQNKILPQNIKDTDVLSDNAKKTLATLMNYFTILNIARSSNYLVCPNTVLRQSVGIRNNELLNAVQELIECDLIERQVGHKRVEGTKPQASEYIIKWTNLLKPIKKKNTFEDFFSEFLKSSGNPLGTTDTVTDSVSDTVTETNTDVGIGIESETTTDVESDVDIEDDDEDVIDDVVNKLKLFRVECYEPKTKVPDEEDLGSYLRRVGRM